MIATNSLSLVVSTETRAMCFFVNLSSLNKVFHFLQVDRIALKDVNGTLESISSTKSCGRLDMFFIDFLKSKKEMIDASIIYIYNVKISTLLLEKHLISYLLYFYQIFYLFIEFSKILCHINKRYNYYD